METKTSTSQTATEIMDSYDNTVKQNMEEWNSFEDKLKEWDRPEPQPRGNRGAEKNKRRRRRTM